MLEEYYNAETGTLTIPFDFNEELKDLACNTKIIIFDQHFGKRSKFNKLLDNLPKKIIYLKLGDSFNQKVDNLPNSLTYLKFGWHFNQNVDNLPNSLTHLKFGSDFSQKVDNLPYSLTHLTLGIDFDQSVDNLPNSLTHLKLKTDFNRSLNNLPSSIKEIIFYISSWEESYEKERIGKMLTKVPCNCKIIYVNRS